MRNQSHLPLATIAGALALALLGCDDNFAPASLLERPRPLGVRVEVEGDPERAWAYPGETSRLQVFAPGPETPTPSLTWAMGACASLGSPVGGRQCASEPFVMRVQRSPSAERPSLRLQYPDAEALGPATEVLVFGVLCPSGFPREDIIGQIPTFAEGACTDETIRSSTFVTVLPLPSATTAPNRNPSLRDTQVLFEGAPWPPPPADAPLTGCEEWIGAGLPRVAAAAATADAPAFAISTSGFPASMRESYQRTVDDPPRTVDARENVLLTHTATLGELDRLFLVFDDSNPPENPDSSIVEWTAPLEGEVDASSRRVDFHFVVLDERGGTDWTTRSLCVVKPVGS